MNFSRFFFAAFVFFCLLTAACSCGDDDSGDDAVSDDSADDSADDSGDDSADDSADDADDDAAGPYDLVVIMADDLDCATLTRLLDDGRMPNLQRYIIDHAAEFTESFVTNPLCCPSRATFLTGQYSHNNNVLHNEPPIGGISTMDDSNTLATWLHDAGYRTSLVGKYLNGLGSATAMTYVPPGWDDWQALIDPTVYSMYDYIINDNGRLKWYGDAVEDYQTDVIAKRTVRFINEAAGDPARIFLWVTPVAPHPEFPEGWFTDFHGFADWYALTIRPAPRHQGLYDLDLPDEPNFDEADVSDKPNWIKIRPRLGETEIANARRQYNDRLMSMLAVDDLIGDVGEALETTGRLPKTVLIFVSDNGFLLGKHRVPQKTADYEESIRVPMYIRVPGRGARTISALVLNNDLAPTLADFAGTARWHDVDGRSLVPLIDYPDREDWRKRFLIQHWAVSDSILDVLTYSAVRTGPLDADAPNMLYVEYTLRGSLDSTELYDVTQDPYQLDSLHRDPTRAAQRDALAARLPAFAVCAGASCRGLEDAE